MDALPFAVVDRPLYVGLQFGHDWAVVCFLLLAFLGFADVLSALSYLL